MSAGDAEMKPASLLHVMKTVVFAALGVRRKSDHERETERIHPAAIIAGGLIAAAVFVLTLVIVVHLVLS